MRRALLSTRSALILLSAVLTGIGAGVLVRLSGAHAAEGVLYGAGAFGLAVPFFDRLIAVEAEEVPGTPS
ncbi:hypothetical protein ACIPYS_26605 [Kitasatospora sp. NPDC089913]|uniref:hypothetical protein n=1 Tax=Kitasatospora sp. NPDC089913 TaxID=3364080 RepID=UPI003807F932